MFLIILQVDIRYFFHNRIPCFLIRLSLVDLDINSEKFIKRFACMSTAFDKLSPSLNLRSQCLKFLFGFCFLIFDLFLLLSFSIYSESRLFWALVFCGCILDLFLPDLSLKLFYFFVELSDNRPLFYIFFFCRLSHYSSLFLTLFDLFDCTGNTYSTKAIENVFDPHAIP